MLSVSEKMGKQLDGLALAEANLVVTYNAPNAIARNPVTGVIHPGGVLKVINNSTDAILVVYPAQFYEGEQGVAQPLSASSGPDNTSEVIVIAAPGNYKLEFHDSVPTDVAILVGSVPIRVLPGSGPSDTDILTP